MAGEGPECNQPMVGLSMALVPKICAISAPVVASGSCLCVELPRCVPVLPVTSYYPR